MRRQRGLVGLTGLAALVGLGMIAKPAMALVTTEQSASILVFPKVIADGTRDTIIQITNTSNNMVHAHCIYVNPALSCLETDFDIWLTKQQPTFWTVADGRVAFPGPVQGRFWPGIPPAVLIPPVAPGFRGELKCIQVDSSGAPVSGNALKGEATLVSRSHDASKYNALGLKGFNTNDGDTNLCLGGAAREGCPVGAEYEACPQIWFLDHPASLSFDIPLGSTSPPLHVQPTYTNLTVVPCTENFETQVPTSVTLQFLVTNEYEQTLSTSTTVRCWASWDLGADLTDQFLRTFDLGVIGGYQLQTRVRSTGATNVGVLPVLEESRGVSISLGPLKLDLQSKAARNAHATPQDQAGGDQITIPPDQGAVVQ